MDFSKNILRLFTFLEEKLNNTFDFYTSHEKYNIFNQMIVYQEYGQVIILKIHKKNFWN